MPDYLASLRSQLEQRLEELRSAADESDRVQAALTALDGAGDGGASSRSGSGRNSRTSTAAPAKPPIASTPAKARRRRQRAPRGANRAAVLAAAQQPGLTATELAAAAGVKTTVVHAVLKGLVVDGALQQQTLDNGKTAYAVSEEA